MPVDVATLAATVVGSYLLPYAKAGIEKITQTVTDKVSKPVADYVADVAKKVWDRVKGSFGSDSDKVILDEFEKDPDTYEGPIKAKLKAKLEQDAALFAELDALTSESGPDGRSVTQIMQVRDISMNFTQANFSGASGFSITGVSQGNPSPPPPAPKPGGGPKG